MAKGTKTGDSVVIEAAATGACWLCLIDVNPVNLY